MIVEIRILDDSGKELVKHTADAMHPTQFRTNNDRPMVQDDYKWFGMTYQPMVTRLSKAGGF